MMKKNAFVLIVCSVLFMQSAWAQISLNLTGAAPNTSAAFDVDFSNLGVLIPRVELTSVSDATTIATPANSLLVFNKGTAGLSPAGYYYNAGTSASPNWVRFMTGKEAWMITGNDNITASSSGYGTAVNNNFIGTTTNIDFAFATNNLERMRIKTDDANNLRIGMGTAYTVNMTGSGNPSILHLHDWGITTNDYSQLNISTSSTNVGRVGVINFGATAVTNDRRTASIESYLSVYSAPNASGDLRFFTNNVNVFQERMRLVETGQLVLSDNSTFPSPTTNYLFTINPTTNEYRSGISILMSGASSTAYAINVSSANANSRGYIYENTSGSNGVFFGTGAILSSTNIASGYTAYRNSSGLSYGLYGINGTNAAYATNANVWAAFIQGRAVISSESSPTSPLGVDLEIRNTTTGSGNPATLSLRQTTQNATSGNLMTNINFGDNYSTNPQAQIQVIRDAASTGTTDLPTSMIFSTTPDASSTLTERMRIANDGKVYIGTNVYTGRTAPLVVQLDGSYSNPTPTIIARANSNTNSFLGIGYDNGNNVGFIQARTDGTSNRPLYLNYLGGDVITNVNGGNVGIGLNNPATDLDVKSVISCVGTNSSASEGGQINLCDYDQLTGGQSNAWSIDNNNNKDFRIFYNSTGSIGLYISHTNGYINIGADLAATYRLQLPTTADNGGTGYAHAWATTSDSRVKTNRETIPYGLNEVLKLKPIKYFYHNSHFENNKLIIDNGGAYDIGFIAQDVYSIMPEIVSKPDDENKILWALNYDKFAPVLVKGIQEQQQIIDMLKSENESLKLKYETLQKRLDEIEAKINSK